MSNDVYLYKPSGKSVNKLRSNIANDRRRMEVAKRYGLRSRKKDVSNNLIKSVGNVKISDNKPNKMNYYKNLIGYKSDFIYELDLNKIRNDYIKRMGNDYYEIGLKTYIDEVIDARAFRERCFCVLSRRPFTDHYFNQRFIDALINRNTSHTFKTINIPTTTAAGLPSTDPADSTIGLAAPPQVIPTVVPTSNPLAERSPPDIHPAVSSSNLLSLKSIATPGDRGGGKDWTSSGIPVADLREAEGQLNREADGRIRPQVESSLQEEGKVLTSVGTASGNVRTLVGRDDRVDSIKTLDINPEERMIDLYGDSSSNYITPKSTPTLPSYLITPIKPTGHSIVNFTPEVPLFSDGPNPNYQTMDPKDEEVIDEILKEKTQKDMDLSPLNQLEKLQLLEKLGISTDYIATRICSKYAQNNGNYEKLKPLSTFSMYGRPDTTDYDTSQILKLY